MSDSITREEQYLNAIANGESIDLKPITREEIFLAKATGQDVKVPTPITRKEMFLSKISGAGNGKPEQEKAVEITENGTTEITADEGYTLSKVTANVNVAASGENKLAQIAEGTLTEITTDDLRGATIIKEYMFGGLRSLERLTLGGDVTQVQRYAFQNCTNLSEITIGGSVEDLSRYAFYNCPKIERVNIDNLAKWCNVTFDNVHTNLLRSGEAKVFIKNASGNYEEVTTATTLVIPDTITQIKDFIFSYFAIGSVTIHNSVTGIGRFAFGYCPNLKSIVIPNSVAQIGESAFRGCSNLTSLTIPSSVTQIDSYALQIGSETNKATITFLHTTPPSISIVLFKVEYLEKIIVPKGCGEAYKTATNWANFADYIEEAAE